MYRDMQNFWKLKQTETKATEKSNAVAIVVIAFKS